MNIKNNRIAHRGVFNNNDIPENSILAFRKAMKMNWAFELDVQLTKDNVLVVFHDDDLKRMTGVNKNVRDIDYNELCGCHLLNTKEKIPTLEEVLKLVKGRVLIDIEVKNTKKIQETCQILLKTLEKYPYSYVLKSFNPKIVRYLKKHSDYEVGYLIHSKYKSSLLRIIMQSSFMIHYSKADYLAIHKKLLKTKKFQHLSLKYPIMVWTIQNKEEIPMSPFIAVCNNIMDNKGKI